MTLDLAGKGVTYKVLEPAIFPILPTGLRFLHFAIAGPLVGIIIPLGLLIALVFFDGKIRFSDQLEDLYPGIVLAVIPESDIKYQNWRLTATMATFLGASYLGAAFSFRYFIA